MKINFETWIKTKARCRGPAASEIAQLRYNFPTYKNPKLYASKYPLATKNYYNFCRRGSQAAA